MSIDPKPAAGRAMRVAAALCVTALCVAPAIRAATVADPSNADAGRIAFVAAMQRLRLHQPDEPDPQALTSYAIYDYLVAARLRRDLQAHADEPTDAAINSFLDLHAGQPVARTLRHDWLVSLGERSRWDWFLPRSADAVDPVIICQRLQGRLATDDTTGLAAAALVRWSLPQKAPGPCSPVFAWLHQQGLITPALAESRTRGALAADNPRLAREFAADVPVTRTAYYIGWSDLLESPKSALNVLATHPGLPADGDALSAGFDKLSRGDPGAAFDVLPLLLARRDVTPVLAGKLKRSAALGAAYSHDTRAVGAFEAIPPEAVDGPVEEWRVRAALWNHDFKKSLAWIEAMHPNLLTQPRWRYWRARSTDELTGANSAVSLYTEVAGTRDYYGYLAADRLHLPYSLNSRPSPDDADIQGSLAVDPGMVRAHALFDCDLADDAAVEWAGVLVGATAPTKVQAAQLASRWGWYAQAISTLAQTGEFDDVTLRYPRPYADIVRDAAKLAQLPSDWILAVMRQESLFRKDAISRADARGLMQMLLPTASAVARRWHLPSPTRDGLLDPSLAVPLGAAYLRELLDRQGGQWVLTLAAYNAGPGAVDRWLPSDPMEADVWIEGIPYNETRGYVQHILEHIVAFAWVQGADPPHLKSLMPPVQPATPAL